MFWSKKWMNLFKKRVYADAAAATPLSARSQRELVRLLSLYGNAGALHKEGVEAKKELEKARRAIADSIGAHADEIIFTASGTESNNLALHGLLRPMLLADGEVHAITCAIEHQSVLEPLRALEREGLYVTTLEVDKEGLVDPEALRAALNEETALVSIQLVNSEVGTIEPVRELVKEIRRVRANRGQSSNTEDCPLYFHTDASQAPLWVGINVEKLGVDLMTLDAQKVLGPKGIGALYVRRGTPVEPILWGGKQEFALRGGTENVPQAGAFAVALADAQSGVEERVKKMTNVRDYLWEEIKRLIPDAILNGPRLKGDALESPAAKASPLGLRAANNLSVSIPGLEAEMAVISLDALGIAASTRSACNIGSAEPSHVIKAITSAESATVYPERSRGAIRLTLLPGATKYQARRIAVALKETADRYRKH